MTIKYDNETIKIKVCNNIFNKFTGLMFKKTIDKNLCFTKCNSIHTFFMFQPIDVVMTDKNYKILYIYKNLKPWKFILPKKNVYYTFEFPIKKFNFKVNEIIKKI